MSDIQISRPDLGKPEIAAISKVLRSGHLAQGKMVAQLEDAFARYCGTKHAIACNNGTTALIMALLASTDLDPFFAPKTWKDRPEVITTPFTFIATANSIVASGAKPVFVDIGPHTFNIDSDLIEEAITKKTIAIMPVHLYGLPCEMGPIMKIAKAHGLKVIEDACQAHGAIYKGKKVGSFGDGGTFSFYPTKNMSTGEGGMVTTNDEMVAQRCAILRNQGQSSGPKGAHKPTYDYRSIGFNWRMTDLSAALGLVQLKKLEKANMKRRSNAKLYDKGLGDLDDIVIPFVPKERVPVYHQYTIRVLNGQRNALREHLRSKNIGTGLYYPGGLYDNPVYKGRMAKGPKDMPNTERAVKEVLSIPVHPLLSKEDIGRVIKEINTFFK
jgi:perosamine synthetase